MPIYRLTKGLTALTLRRAIRALVDRVATDLEEPLPEELRTRLGLMPIARAIEEAHWPQEFAARDAALRRLAFDELLRVQLVLVMRKRAIVLVSDGTDVTSGSFAIGASAAATDFDRSFQALLPPGLYEVYVDYSSYSSVCARSSDEAAVVTATGSEKATGGGWYLVNGANSDVTGASPRVSFGFNVQRVSGGYRGQLLWMNTHQWRLKASFTTGDVATVTVTLPPSRLIAVRKREELREAV